MSRHAAALSPLLIVLVLELVLVLETFVTPCRVMPPRFSPNSEVWTRPRRRPSSSMRRRFLQRKEPDCPAIILFRYSDCETSGFPRTRTTRTRTSPNFGILGLSTIHTIGGAGSIARKSHERVGSSAFRAKPSVLRASKAIDAASIRAI